MMDVARIGVMAAVIGVMSSVSTSMAEPVISGSADEMGREVRVGWKFQLGQERAESIKVPPSFVDNERITYIASGGIADKPPLYKSKGLWISVAAIVAVVMIGDNNDWSFSSSSSDNKVTETDGRSLTIELANGSTVGDDINISNLTINNFSTPESEESSE